MPSRAFPDVLFRRACAQFATGVAVATARAGDGSPQGLTVNSFTSVSLDPPLVLICIDNRAAVLPHFLAAGHFGVNILAEDQQGISNRFAGAADDRFDGVEWRAGLAGSPLIEGALAVMECAVRRVVEGGDHQILIGEVVSAEIYGGRPLVYFNSGYRKL